MLIVAVPPMVQNAKSVALDINDPKAASKWRDSNRAVSDYDKQNFCVCFD